MIKKSPKLTLFVILLVVLTTTGAIWTFFFSNLSAGEVIKAALSRSDEASKKAAAVVDTLKTPEPTPVDATKAHEPNQVALFLHNHRAVAGFVRILFWLAAALIILSILVLFYILVLHNVFFPNGIATGFTAFDDAMDWLFDFLKAEEGAEMPHDPLEHMLTRRGLFSGRTRQ